MPLHSIEHPIIGELSWRDGDDCSSAIMTDPFVPDWQVRYMYVYDPILAEVEPYAKQQTVDFYAEEADIGRGPSAAQVRAWQYFMENRDRLRVIAEQELHNFLQEAIVVQLGGSLSDADMEIFEQELIRKEARQLQGVKNQVRFAGLTVFSETFDDIALYELRFANAWDHEHSIRLLFYKDQCLTAEFEYLNPHELHLYLPGGPWHRRWLSRNASE